MDIDQSSSSEKDSDGEGGSNDSDSKSGNNSESESDNESGSDSDNESGSESDSSEDEGFDELFEEEFENENEFIKEIKQNIGKLESLREASNDEDAAWHDTQIREMKEFLKQALAEWKEVNGSTGKKGKRNHGDTNDGEGDPEEMGDGETSEPPSKKK